jgi:hypothetical protein
MEKLNKDFRHSIVYFNFDVNIGRVAFGGILMLTCWLL